MRFSAFAPVLLASTALSHNWFADPPVQPLEYGTIAANAVPARRICRPGPQKARPSWLSSATGWVLIIGDSISLGAMNDLQAALGTAASIQHAPWSGDGGALDSKYAMDTNVEMVGAGAGPAWVGNGSLAKYKRFGDGCVNGTFLKTATQQETKYDVISFNYGVHDVDYSAYHEEWVPLDVYQKNVRAIKLTLLATGAKVVFQSSTPVSYNITTNARIVAFNAAAKAVMAEEPTASYNDLYAAIVAVCGQPPYNSKANPTSPNCSIADYNGVHYHSEGWQVLANSTAASIKALLPKSKSKANSIRADADAAADDDAVQCTSATGAKTPTACPVNSTCMKNAFSSTGAGCCIGHGANAVACSDGVHCCPTGWTCSNPCRLGGCFCAPPSSSSSN